MARVRADRLLVGRGLAASIDAAARSIRAGEVWSGSERVRTPGVLLAADAPLSVSTRKRFVSRGGEKLAAGLGSLGIDPRGRVCLDAGCSTGGFTDCLLQMGASRVYAVDVGYGQLAWSLRSDERVVVMERTNIRSLAAADLDPRPALIVADLSFISLRTVLPVLSALLPATGGEMVLLVKPQFELSREDVPGGVVREAELQSHAVTLVEQAARDLGLAVVGRVVSPLRGPKGNREFLVALRAEDSGC